MAVSSAVPASSVAGDLIGDPLRAAFRVADLGDIAYLLYLVLPHRALMEVGRVRGWLDYALRTGARRAVRGNLRDIHPDASAWRIETLTRRFFEYHHMRSVLLLLGPLMAARGDLERILPIEGMEHLEQARADGHGVILLGAHVNSVGGLLAIMVLRRLGVDVRSAFPDPEDAWTRTYFRQFIDRRFGAQTMGDAVCGFYAQFNIRPIVKAIKEGEALLLMGDGWHTASFTEVQFLGRTVPFTTGPLGVARLTGATVLPCFIVGTPERLGISIQPGFRVAPARTDPADLERKTVEYANRVERHLLAHLPCWQHLPVPNVFETMQGQLDKSIAERYAI